MAYCTYIRHACIGKQRHTLLEVIKTLITAHRVRSGAASGLDKVLVDVLEANSFVKFVAALKVCSYKSLFVLIMSEGEMSHIQMTEYSFYTP